MPSMEHEGLVALFQNRPTLATELLELAHDVQLPPFSDARLESESLTQLDPAAYLADAVIVYRDGDTPVLAIVVEVQRQAHPDKPFRWSVYTATVFERYRCPVRLLVVTPDPSVARWARRPIETQAGSPWQPLVLGPDNIPLVTDVEEARLNPERTVLSFIAHARSVEPATGVQLAYAAMQACNAVRSPLKKLYWGTVDSLLTEDVAVLLEAILDAKGEQELGYFGRKERDRLLKEGREEGIEKGREEGIEKGRELEHRELLLQNVEMLLGERFGPLPKEATERIQQANNAQLLRMLKGVLTAESLEAVLKLDAD